MVAKKVLLNIIPILLLTMAVITGPANAAPAGADTEAGDSCAGLPDGATRMVADADGSYADIILICNSGTWEVDETLQLSSNSDTCTAERAGSLRYNSTVGAAELCDNLEWKLLIGEEDFTDPTPPATDPGYFVLTKDKWYGDIRAVLGDVHPTALEAADQLCLTDLTNNDWKGKADASARGLISAANVKAFLCRNGTCNQAAPNETYYFAVSGDATAGGASFTTDGSGLGPGNSQNWAGINYFKGFKEYWTGRDTDNDLSWMGSHATNGYERCGFSGFLSSTGERGRIGISNGTDDDRWSARVVPCEDEYKLICFVNP